MYLIFNHRNAGSTPASPTEADVALRDYEKQKAYMREYLKRRHAQRRIEALRALGSKCVRCGSIVGLEIDHIDRSRKELSFERMAVVSRQRFLVELAKCQLLCGVCHHKKSVEEVGHNSRDTHGTLVSYQRGKCRCDACKAANAAACREYDLKKRIGV